MLSAICHLLVANLVRQSIRLNQQCDSLRNEHGSLSTADGFAFKFRTIEENLDLSSQRISPRRQRLDSPFNGEVSCVPGVVRRECLG